MSVDLERGFRRLTMVVAVASGVLSLVSLIAVAVAAPKEEIVAGGRVVLLVAGVFAAVAFYFATWGVFYFLRWIIQGFVKRSCNK